MKQIENKVTPRILSGFMELLPADQISFNKYLSIIRDTYEEFGFIPQETPLIEAAEILMSKSGGDTEKQIYEFMKGDERLALRFDLTVPLARYVAQYYPQLVFPYRRYQIGKVYRGERAQKGRFREFYQCDIDIIGDGELSLVNDAEIPSVIYRLFRKLDIGDFVIKINNRKILSGFIEAMGLEKEDEALRIIDKLEKIGNEEVIRELVNLGLKEEDAAKLIELISISGSNEEILIKLQEIDINVEKFGEGVRELIEVVKMAYKFGVPEESLQIDLSIARGLGYYTGTVYETKMKNEEISGSVCSGGRYDNLAENFTDRKLPGVGISIGLTRLFSQLKSAGLIKEESVSVSRVAVVPMEGARMDFSLNAARLLREAGIKTEIYTEDTKLKKKLSYVNKLGIPYLVLVGEDEERQGKVSLKKMQTGEQWLMTVEEVISMIINK
ncbi:MAG: histidyl-tRNA synthetase, histidyl-tRNA synthetase [Candidatus Collierbacteria bacterium GW2011_GWC1_45_47]|uniref:Histidine--tRNA ligase n=4 Tax=Candidatus Collieribacteriota TaxID=1752725 RepID=A0A0G1HH40_9BACT|nr:MAG: Histidine-tRNA ligase [Candidatus Collierbacteria bacterium GW2011_GWF1_44_12]KKT46591.1 MAG: Histidine-tRNA ligase [Candidatus Collierbacteria bacterium GW2011_GWF2_44_15]KKT67983.1 MAG: Histidine-tRNA ligase [Candidatus Collierbacteria bacterium GW2011_GWB1_44_35]KKU09461.1 MAG: histidyl-tRNA synthetase, histidyl-tRNA synthetase [Candidatus Collierbacteria bacterium GW2011_GWC1_45_47]KKU29546.1 MAG: Histidine-tRNA ligase [Candidatus Collierbacteria bacterium GW2011_GWE1_46_18]